MVLNPVYILYLYLSYYMPDWGCCFFFNVLDITIWGTAPALAAIAWVGSAIKSFSESQIQLFSYLVVFAFFLDTLLCYIVNITHVIYFIHTMLFKKLLFSTDRNIVHCINLFISFLANFKWRPKAAERLVCRKTCSEGQ